MNFDGSNRSSSSIVQSFLNESEDELIWLKRRRLIRVVKYHIFEKGPSCVEQKLIDEIIEVSKDFRDSHDEQRNEKREEGTGLKESKLGVLAESKLTPSAVTVATSNIGAKQTETVSGTAAPVTFQFTPLTKPSDSEDNKSKSGFRLKSL